MAAVRLAAILNMASDRRHRKAARQEINAHRRFELKRIEFYTDDLEEAWRGFVNEAPGATVAHQIEFRRIISRGLGCKPVYLLARDDVGITGVLPLFLVRTWWNARYLVSVPWLDYGGVCATDRESACRLIERAQQLADSTGASFVELRSVEPSGCELATSFERVTFLTDLSLGAETIWKAFDAKLRNQVRKAQKSGFAVEYGQHEFLDDFYKVFSRRMHDLGTPVWGKQLFAATLEAFPRSAHIVLVKKGEETATGALLLQFRGRDYIPSAAAYDRFLKNCPYHALYWSVIERGCKEGSRWFDFGRSAIDSPTYKFKIQWSEIPIPLAWQYSLHRTQEIPRINPHNPKYRLARSIWSKLPLALANRLGPVVIRNFP